MGLFRRRISRAGHDRFRISLPAHELELVRNLLPQLRELLTVGLAEDDPSLTRLFPTAYPDDPDLDAGYQALVRDELLEKRLATIDLVESTISSAADGETLTGDELAAWMRAANDVRLVLGTRLDVSEDDDHGIDPSDPEAGAWAVYDYLGVLVASAVDALAGDL